MRPIDLWSQAGRSVYTHNLTGIPCRVRIPWNRTRSFLWMATGCMKKVADACMLVCQCEYSWGAPYVHRRNGKINILPYFILMIRIALEKEWRVIPLSRSLWLDSGIRVCILLFGRLDTVWLEWSITLVPFEDFTKVSWIELKLLDCVAIVLAADFASREVGSLQDWHSHRHLKNRV